jgi:hypothetical protein
MSKTQKLTTNHREMNGLLYTSAYDLASNLAIFLVWSTSS